MVRHPGRPEYVSGAELDREAFARGLRSYSERRDWVIDGILYDRTLRRDVMDRADDIVHLALPLRTSELHVFKRRLRRGKRVTLEFLARRARKARKHPRHKRELKADLEAHLTKTVNLRSHREVDRYLAELRARQRPVGRGTRR